jgi:type IV secretion system protein VirB1
MSARLIALTFLAAGTVPALPAPAAANIPFEPLAARCAPGVHVSTLSAIVWHESRYNPLAIGLNSKTARLPRQPRNRAEAVATAQWLIANGYNFDSGLGQVNIKNVGWLGMSLDDLFEPCANLKGAERVLTACYAKALRAGLTGQPALHGALSCYNAGNLTRGIRNGYVQSVASRATLRIPVLLQQAPKAATARVVPARDPEDANQDSTVILDTTKGATIVEQTAQPDAVAEPERAEREGDADLFSNGDRDVFRPTKPKAAKKPQPSL